MNIKPINPAAAVSTITAMRRHYELLGDRLFAKPQSSWEKDRLVTERRHLQEWLARYEAEAQIDPTEEAAP